MTKTNNNIDFAKATLAVLKDACREQGLKVSGNKAALKARLEAHFSEAVVAEDSGEAMEQVITPSEEVAESAGRKAVMEGISDILAGNANAAQVIANVRRVTDEAAPAPKKRSKKNPTKAEREAKVASMNADREAEVAADTEVDPEAIAAKAEAAAYDAEQKAKATAGGTRPYRIWISKSARKAGEVDKAGSYLALLASTKREFGWMKTAEEVGTVEATSREDARDQAAEQRLGE